MNTTAKKSIQLYQENDISKSWFAIHLDENGNSDPYILSLFGTNVLPTPFYGDIPRETVLAQIKAGNPDKNVVIS